MGTSVNATMRFKVKYLACQGNMHAYVYILYMYTDLDMYIQMHVIAIRYEYAEINAIKNYKKKFKLTFSRQFIITYIYTYIHN